MKNLNMLVVFILLLTNCSNSYHYEYWDISKFNIKNDALENSEEIKIIYTSRGPDHNEEQKYYIHLIAVSQKSGDTVNILTMFDNGIAMNDKDKIYNFFDQDNKITKSILMVLNKKDTNNIELKKIDKVARDPKYDFIADNNYPTIIGTIGTIEK